MNWYVVHAYSGFENQVKRSLEDRIKRHAMEEKFGQILVPTEEVVEMKDGQKRKSDRKFFPGYVLVEMEMDNDSWHLVKDCPKVMGFIGGTSDRPAPISKREAQAILRGLRGLDLIGGDVVEVSPPFDPSGNTALVGATMLFEILCLLADAVARRRA